MYDKIEDFEFSMIKKPNSILRAKTGFKSIWCTRILAVLIEQIKPKDQPDETYKVNIHDIIKYIPEKERPSEITIESAKTKRELYRASKSMLTCAVKFNDPKYNWKEILLVTYTANEKNSPYIEFRLDKEIKQLLFDYKNGYTYENLKDLFSLRSIYSQKLYELLLSWSWIPEETKSFYYADLLEALNVPKSMCSFAIFKPRILKTSLKEINEKTSLKLDFKQHKVGKFTEKVEFIYLNKPETQRKTKYDKKITAKQEEQVKAHTNKEAINFQNNPINEIIDIYMGKLSNWADINKHQIFIDSYKEKINKIIAKFPEAEKVQFWEEYLEKVATNSFLNSSEFRNKNFIWLLKEETYFNVMNNYFTTEKDIKELNNNNVKNKKIVDFIMDNMGVVFIDGMNQKFQIIQQEQDFISVNIETGVTGVINDLYDAFVGKVIKIFEEK